MRRRSFGPGDHKGAWAFLLLVPLQAIHAGFWPSDHAAPGPTLLLTKVF